MIDTINIVNKEVSKTLGLDEDLVRIVNKFFWKQGIKRAIQSGDHTSIWIKNIGTLATSRNKVNNKIRRLIKSIRSLDQPRDYKVKTKEQFLVEKYSQLRMLLARRNDIALAYKANKDRAHEKYKLYKAGLGQQITDTARLSILDSIRQGDQEDGQREDEDMQGLSILLHE